MRRPSREFSSDLGQSYTLTQHLDLLGIFTEIVSDHKPSGLAVMAPLICDQNDVSRACLSIAGTTAKSNSSAAKSSLRQRWQPFT